jgi:diguanylate cyclase (GGDEF)-like protein/PAS domain S-box-containing protein
MTLRDLQLKVDKGAPARLRSMVDRTTDVVLLLDGDARIGYANRRLTARYGFDQDEVVGHAFTALVPPEDRPAFEEWFATLTRSAGSPTDARIRLGVAMRGPGAGVVAPIVEWHGTDQLDDPLIAGVILNGRDVTDLVAMERRLADQTDQLRHAADHDALTGLLNRRAFAGAVAEVLAERRALDDPGDAVVLFCDLDRFKDVNDTYGHAVGDEVLRVAADRLRGAFRDDDLIARWGGDEFAVLLAGSPPDAAVAELVDRIETLLRMPIRGGSVTAAVGVTVGTSRAAALTAEPDDLLRRADEAMYHRKPRR